MMESSVAEYQARKILIKNQKQHHGQGGKRISTKKYALRGRCVGSTGDATSQKIHVLDSIRRQAIKGMGFSDGVSAENIRYQTLVRRSGTLVTFLVDTSGSMLAQKRIEMAKGCVMSLLKDAYVNRDQVAMITFGGKEAQVVLPPTASPEQASQMLKKIPTGGKTPMIDAFKRAIDLTEKITDRPVFFVVVSDGRYSRLDSGNPDFLIRKFGSFCQKKQAKILVVDVEEKSIFALGRAKILAEMIQATYIRIDDLRDDVLIDAVGKILYVS